MYPRITRLSTCPVARDGSQGLVMSSSATANSQRFTSAQGLTEPLRNESLSAARVLACSGRATREAQTPRSAAEFLSSAAG